MTSGPSAGLDGRGEGSHQDEERGAAKFRFPLKRKRNEGEIREREAVILTTGNRLNLREESAKAAGMTLL